MKPLIQLVPLLVIFLPITFCSTYISAVMRGITKPFIPYISYTVCYPPESSVFAFVTTLESPLVLTIHYVKYCQVKHFIEKFPEIRSKLCHVPRLNKMTLVFGFLKILGANIVCNYQACTVHPMHAVGGILFYGCGFIYFCLMTYLSMKTTPYGVSKSIVTLRQILVFLQSMSVFVMSLLCVVYYIFHINRRKTQDKSIGRDVWSNKIIALYEWVLTLSFSFYLMTFYDDFKTIFITPPKFSIKTNSVP